LIAGIVRLYGCSIHIPEPKTSLRKLLCFFARTAEGAPSASRGIDHSVKQVFILARYVLAMALEGSHLNWAMMGRIA